MSDAPDGPGSARELPLDLVSELLRVVPRFLDRTRSQAELVGSLGRGLPCLGALLGPQGNTPDPDPDEVPAGMHETTEVDVLSVLEASPPDPAADDSPAPATQDPVAATEAAPTESELPIQDYDSLAASQVVPRLATLSPEELRSVRSYELAHRHRQTILNRVAQRLAD